MISLKPAVYIRLWLYADDTTLISNNLTYFGNNIQTNDNLIIAELSNVVEWLNINKLSLNKSKSKYYDLPRS